MPERWLELTEEDISGHGCRDVATIRLSDYAFESRAC
jgi:hypothetical protein